MDHLSEHRLLLIETSGRVGQVGLADGTGVLRARRLDEARRHARDLAPALRDLLRELGWRPTDVTGVVVSRGPGSYTGLRVGIMSAKAFAYAIGCPILAIDTFAMLALQACVSSIEIIEDAQQERLYCQRFTLEGRLPKPATELRIVPFAEWRDSLSADVRVTGPGLYRFGERLRAEQLLPRDLWSPRLEALHQLALDRLARGEHDDLWRLEPLYARPSSAEEQWQRLGR